MSRFLGLVAGVMIGAGLLGAPVGDAEAKRRTVRVGVVLDGPWEWNESLRASIERECQALMRNEANVLFPKEKRLVADGTLKAVRTRIDRLLRDGGVDVVLAMGLLSSTEVGRRSSLPKPVIAPTVADPTYQGLPYKKGTSGVKNLNYLVLPFSFGSYLSAFHRVVPGNRVTFLAPRALSSALPQLPRLVQGQAKELGLEMTVVIGDDDPAQILEQVPEDTQAVYIAPLSNLSREGLQTLIDGLNARRLPTFSHFGDDEVPMGTLAGFVQQAHHDRVARRVALNLQRILLGEDPGKLPVAFSTGELQLVVNMATARAIRFYPKWAVLSEAEILNAERGEGAPRDNLVTVVDRAIEVNLTLASLRKSVEADGADVGIARGALLPQINLQTQGTVIDEDRARAGFGSNPERAAVGRATASQLIFSEEAWARLSVEKHLQRSREEDLQQTRLDTAFEAASTYLNVLKAKRNERLLQQNVRLTRANLELARLRETVGLAGPAERLRWQNKIALDQRDVITASAQRNQIEIQMNRVLNRSLEQPLVTTDPFESDESPDRELLAATATLFAQLDNPWSLRQFRAFMVDEGLEASPEVRALNAAMAAQRRGLDSVARAFWLPNISLQGELSHRYYAEGAGQPGGPSPIEGFQAPDDTNWSIAAVLSFPLFAGSSRVFAYFQAQDDLMALELQRDAIRQSIEERVRASVHQVGASYAGIALANDAAEAARQTLELVTEAYSRGASTILDLLDAQNAAFAADQVAATQGYDFLLDLMQVLRAGGSFDLLRPDQRGEWIQRWQLYLEQQRGNGAP